MRNAVARLTRAAVQHAAGHVHVAAAQIRAASTVPEGVRAAFGYCVSQVKQYDYQNYVWIAQLARELRPAMFALRAFNVETALIAEQVRSKESALVQIRFQWWRDAVNAAFNGRPPNHPVALALAHVLAEAPGPQQRVTRYPFKRILDTREQDLLDTQPPLDLPALEQYAEGTAAQLLYLQLAAMGVKSKDADHAASHVGRAVGISLLLRGTAVHAASRRSYLPVELCAEHHVSQEDLYAGVASEGVRDVVHKVASLAKGHLDEARRLAPKLPRQACQALLPAVACGHLLDALERANFDPFDPSVLQGGVSPLRYLLSLKYHQVMGSF